MTVSLVKAYVSAAGTMSVAGRRNPDGCGCATCEARPAPALNYWERQAERQRLNLTAWRATVGA